MRWKNEVPSKAELRDAKRDAVLREASLSFNRRGYHGTSLDDVAQRLGVTKAALYYYFPNKQAVLKACFDQVMEASFVNVARAIGEGGDGRTKLRNVLSRYLEYLIDDLSVSVTMMEEDALSPADMSAVKTQRDLFEDKLRDLVKEGIKDGSIVSCDPKLAVFAILGAVNWTPRWFRTGGAWTNAQLAEGLSEMLDRMLSSAPTAALTPMIGGRKTRRAKANVLGTAD